MGLVLTRDSLQDHVGEMIGESEWIEITQENVNKFADVTVDPQFIHVDEKRAAETPFGGTIAHGFLTLSMLTFFAQTGGGISVEGGIMGINYGMNKVRFIHPVRVGKRIRGKFTLLDAIEKKPNQFQITQEVVVEIEGVDKPALIAEWITMAMTA
jgi:acyl dehydratase